MLNFLTNLIHECGQCHRKYETSEQMFNSIHGCPRLCVTKEFKERPDRLFWIFHTRKCTPRFLRRYRDADVNHHVEFTTSLDISSRTASKIARGG